MIDRRTVGSGCVRRCGLVAAGLMAGALVGCRPAVSTETPPPSALSTPASSSPAAVDEPGWERVTEADGIVVTSRPSSNNATPEFRGVGQVDAPLVDVLAVVTDADRHHEWVWSCTESALVAQTSDDSGVVYNRTATPWPVPDRDVVLDSRVEIVDGESEVVVRFAAMEHPDRPVREGLVRMPYLRGHYHLWAIDADHTRVEYQVDSDPGGSLPAGLAARGTRDMPLETLRALRLQVDTTRGTYERQIERFRRTLLSPESPQ